MQRAAQCPRASVFVTIGFVPLPGVVIVTVAPATGLPLALSTTFPCNRPVPRICALAAIAMIEESTMSEIDFRIGIPFRKKDPLERMPQRVGRTRFLTARTKRERRGGTLAATAFR